ncbi:hypothetical protein D2E24_0536 [Bifidobacterium samirii]|uniref:Uncharacterized protein n=1 Tax=Bifidobacterium samirii TaxID=2306974 RepID=A0A430FVY7_9BIFI|nr:hypothetical protein D2E24_0536 [Bifidobacterium samirii]
MRAADRRGDHPHVRREHIVVSTGLPLESGSSPRAQGTLLRDLFWLAPSGIIPACAGNTCGRWKLRHSVWDHPRVRREHAAVSSSHIAPLGSSPRAQGTRDGGRDRGRPAGIIPACAGNTTGLVVAGGRLRDHPRVRREHLGGTLFRSGNMGSSPRAQGTRVGEGVAVEKLGIIPACAGNTCRQVWESSSNRDHPRVRREHLAWPSCGGGVRGSSPRAQGTLPPWGMLGVRAGIIPACAGNTPPASSTKTEIWDHPRVRREHQWGEGETPERKGSSPRAQGTPMGRGRDAGTQGIIPACAGNTRRVSRPRCRARDHPRVRREHPARTGRPTCTPGSSPRAQGTQATG